MFSLASIFKNPFCYPAVRHLWRLPHITFAWYCFILGNITAQHSTEKEQKWRIQQHLEDFCLLPVHTHIYPPVRQAGSSGLAEELLTGKNNSLGKVPREHMMGFQWIWPMVFSLGKHRSEAHCYIFCFCEVLIHGKTLMINLSLSNTMTVCSLYQQFLTWPTIQITYRMCIKQKANNSFIYWEVILFLQWNKFSHFSLNWIPREVIVCDSQYVLYIYIPGPYQL